MRECYFISCSSKSLEVELMTKSSIFTCLDGVGLFVVFHFSFIFIQVCITSFFVSCRQLSLDFEPVRGKNKALRFPALLVVSL